MTNGPVGGQVYVDYHLANSLPLCHIPCPGIGIEKQRKLGCGGYLNLPLGDLSRVDSKLHSTDRAEASRICCPLLTIEFQALLPQVSKNHCIAAQPASGWYLPPTP